MRASPSCWAAPFSVGGFEAPPSCPPPLAKRESSVSRRSSGMGVGVENVLSGRTVTISPGGMVTVDPPLLSVTSPASAAKTAPCGQLRQM